ncbi:MAG: LPS assembly protein LptD [Kiritimatiellae bacterium]|nr:LPS assembly protein LptD [Kiritimatiellia bacterium]
MPNTRIVQGLAILLTGATVAFGQMPFEGTKRPSQSAQPAEAGQSEIDISADSLEYLSERKLIVGTGNVVIREGEDLLQADYMTVGRDTHDVFARGNVVFRRGGTLWQGEELRYNLKTKTGDFGEFQAYMDPFYVRAEDSKRVSTNAYELTSMTISTCEGETPDFSLRARKATLTDGTVVRAKGVTVNVGNVPIFWLPRLNRDLGESRTYWQFMPGYSSRHGAFLRSAYNYRIKPGFKGWTDIDLYSKKGVGVGQGFAWQSETNPLPYSGSVRGYYIDDQEPFRSEGERQREQDLVDNERYRLKLSHNQSFTDRDFLISEFNYLSDPEFLKDFFRPEHINGVQPENRATLTHVGNNFVAALQLNTRLNDFYENVNRLPELTLKANRQELGGSGLFYESDNSAAYLERVYPEGSSSEDYDAFRIDSAHMLYYPTRHFGFLNFTPRAGYRGTYYSDTFEYSTVTNQIVNTDSNGVVTVEDEVVKTRRELGADLRNVYELGFETSFKAFRTWDDLIVLGDGDGLRHVAEPYLKHTYIPEPNLLRENLPQFDSVDRVEETHTLRLGMRNKLQTRRNQQPVDLVNANVYTDYRLEKDKDEEDFSDVYFKVELRLSQQVPIDFEGAYDPYESEFSRFSAQAAIMADDLSALSLDYNYARDNYNQAGVELKLFPNARWSFITYARWDMEGEGLQEHSYYVQRQTRCLGYGIGFRQIVKDEAEEEDENIVWVQLWLMAFPDSSLNIGG